MSWIVVSKRYSLTKDTLEGDTIKRNIINFTVMRYKLHNMLFVEFLQTTKELVEVIGLDENMKTYSLRNIKGDVFEVYDKDLTKQCLDINMTSNLLIGLKFEKVDNIDGSSTFTKYLVSDNGIGYQIVVVKYGIDYTFVVQVQNGEYHSYPIGSYPDLQNKVYEQLGFYLPFSLNRIAAALGKQDYTECMELLDCLFDTSVMLKKKIDELHRCCPADEQRISEEKCKIEKEFLDVCQRIDKLRSLSNDRCIDALWQTMNQIHQCHYGTK